MFKFLKEKLKNAVSKFTSDVEEAVEETASSKTDVVQEEVKEEVIEESSSEESVKEEKPKSAKEKKESVKKEILKEKTPSQKKEKTEKKAEKILKEEMVSEPVIEETIEEAKEEIHEEKLIETLKETEENIIEEPVKEKKQGFFSRFTEKVTKKKLSESKFDELFFEIEIALLEANIAMEVIEKIKQDLKDALVDESMSMFKTKEIIENTLKNSISELLDFEKIELSESAKEKKPYVIAFIGVNGTGKTTNLAKLAYKLKEEGYEVVIAACDTFRAAAIQQVEEHANNIGVKLIKHDYGSDAAAVAFDAINHAKSKGKDFVLIDTAGRNQANSNLMEELKKIIRVTKPDMKIFVGDSLTGNDAVEQAQQFNDAVGIDAIILSKVDADEKGGASVSISYVTKKPIIFIGNGQGYNDLHPFKKQEFLEKMGF